MKKILSAIAGMVLLSHTAFGAVNTFAVLGGTTNDIANNYKKQASQLGQMLGAQKKTIMYNASAYGVAGALLEGAYTQKANIVGVSTPELFKEQCPEKHLCNQTEFMMQGSVNDRNLALFNEADAIVIMPGDWDTLSTFTTYATLIELEKLPKKPIIFLDINNFWYQFKRQLEEMYRQKTLDVSKLDYILFVDKPRDIIEKANKLQEEIEQYRESDSEPRRRKISL